jgi:hypothetical protein
MCPSSGPLHVLITGSPCGRPGVGAVVAVTAIMTGQGMWQPARDRDGSYIAPSGMAHVPAETFHAIAQCAGFS